MLLGARLGGKLLVAALALEVSGLRVVGVGDAVVEASAGEEVVAGDGRVDVAGGSGC